MKKTKTFFSYLTKKNVYTGEKRPIQSKQKYKKRYFVITKKKPKKVDMFINESGTKKEFYSLF